MLIGARLLFETLRLGGVDCVFANPGTSEMHFVAAMDETPDVRGVLCLFEGVATGAADGYARVTGRPAATLLHLGPGLANGWANLHNARRARVPVVNIVGDHATYHGALDPPLESDVAAVAGALEGWTRRSLSADALSTDAADAVRAAYGPPGRIATLIVPADVSWNEAAPTPPPIFEPPRARVAAAREIDEARRALLESRAALVLGGRVNAPMLKVAHRICAATGAGFFVETFPTSMERGGGLPSPTRINYLSEFAQLQLQDFDVVIPIGTTPPVAFFAYEGLSNELLAPGTRVIDVAPPGVDALGALESLAEGLAVTANEESVVWRSPEPPDGALTAESLAHAVAATAPEDLIVVDESNTSGLHLYDALAGAARHHWFTLTGGSIGFGLPVAVGAAIASGGRVLALEADGSFMYTNQALWTMAREGLDVTIVALVNHTYGILRFERRRLGILDEGSASERMLSLDRPAIDYCALSHSMGVPAERVDDARQFTEALRRSYTTPGPTLIEVEVARVF